MASLYLAILASIELNRKSKLAHAVLKKNFHADPQVSYRRDSKAIGMPTFSSNELVSSAVEFKYLGVVES
jgi:hypothetical protein